MTIDDAMLAEVEAARAALDALEDQAFQARARFHRELRRLHGAGASLREVAAALGMSHQRVHQIIGEDGVVEVEAAAREVVPLPPGPEDSGARAPAGPGRTTVLRRSPRVRCAFCNAGPGDTPRMVAGGAGVHICPSCAAAAAEVAATGRPARGPRQLTLRHAMGEPHPCRFCGRPPARVGAMVAGGRGRICDRCLGLCRQAFATGATP